jgi:hypothetical protein
MSIRAISRKICTFVFIFGTTSTAHADVIDAYFGMNFVAAGFPGGSITALEVNLLNIRYVGGDGNIYNTAMPAFPGNDPVLGDPRQGMPDNIGLVDNPTYTTTVDGDGETTRTLGVTVPINWDTSGAIPTIGIIDITVDSPGVGGIWTARFSSLYTVGLIPAGSDTELSSSLVNPQNDIYGNPTGTVIAISTPGGDFDQFLGTAFGEFIFAAASPVPVPAAVWLFGSGLLGLVGIARRKKS